jgi:3',5'-cyclic AMP phosphodiesterase CpdA
MPVTLPPLTRRRFLAAAGALAVSPSLGRGADPDPHRVALLSDSHVGEKPEATDRDCNMADRLRQVAAEIAKLDVKPACAVIDGDLAHKTGTPAEYGLFAKLIEPVREAGIPLHLGLGNHDNFTRFADGLAKLRPKDRPVEGKQVVVAELDSTA